MAREALSLKKQRAVNTGNGVAPNQYGNNGQTVVNHANHFDHPLKNREDRGTSEVTNSASTLHTPTGHASEDEDEGEELIVVPTEVRQVGPRKSSTNSKAEEIPTFTHKSQILGIPKSFVNTRSECEDIQEEPKRISKALQDDSWVEAMQEELLQFRLQQLFICDYVKPPRFGCISDQTFARECMMHGRLRSVKLQLTPMETKMALTKDEEANAVDVHLYKFMIGSLQRIHIINACEENLLNDYAGENLDRKSTIGGCQFLRSRLISWQCKKQTIMATSTTEAEYVSATSCFVDNVGGSQSSRSSWNSISTIILLQFPTTYISSCTTEVDHLFHFYYTIGEAFKQDANAGIMGNAIVKLVKNVKKLEKVVMSRRVVLIDFEDEAAENSSKQGRNLQKDESEVFETPKQGKSSGETDISPQGKEETDAERCCTGLEDVVLVSKIASHKRRKMAEKETVLKRAPRPKRTKKQIREEQASLAEIARIQAEEEAENARREELKRQDELAAKRFSQEKSLVKEIAGQKMMLNPTWSKECGMNHPSDAVSIGSIPPGLLNDLTRDDLKELYRLMMLKYGDNVPEEEFEIEISHADDIFLVVYVHCLTVEAAHIYYAAPEVKYPLPPRVCKAMLGKKLLGYRKDESTMSNRHKDWLVRMQTALSWIAHRIMACGKGCGKFQFYNGCQFTKIGNGVSGFGMGKVVLSTFEELQMLGFFLQMGFTLILATLDGLDVGLLVDVIGEDDCDEDE
ncbi:hypothetical protein Tco_1266315 [Tanacetum coccineum]